MEIPECITSSLDVPHSALSGDVNGTIMDKIAV